MEYYVRMKANHVYFPSTTPQQRKLLFESWEQTSNVTAACKIAHVGRATFYYWKPRFTENGYAGLETYEKVGVPVGTGRISVEIQTEVVKLHSAHTTWGKQRLADEIAKSNNWVPLVSPNCVRRILIEAKLWNPESNREKKRSLRR
jgi:transposase